MTNREKLLMKINKNPDKFLYHYNCRVLNFFECNYCVVRKTSERRTRCEEAYKEWLDKEADQTETRFYTGIY